MKVETTEIPDVLLLTPKRFEDSRGYFAETYSARALEDHGIQTRFIQDNMSYSERAGTVRGLHYQAPPHAQTKLIRCTRGAIIDVALDIRIGSPTYGRYVRHLLSAENMCQLYIPAGFAHGFSTLSDNTEVHYKVDARYAPECERGIAFDDGMLGIDWRLGGISPAVSDKDRQLPGFEHLEPEFTCIAGSGAEACAS
ncbi:dTDP-4-dehydrorhamnose 3,5-epimerase [Roseibium salinum]|uniref:dTDP-4-dehydrorhamnose 3,5-epimerase n=1 Tax=Roseibium salinum TaxID=1604349 RepID=A0ABT3R0W9_9HYPH|nr:dTDP-4-dehydrorhamnose 3,5-epimerase [Roseibium sp. DSM 29163]MCX2722854.1 dTDP-4-dehydrorhamnose 3,5-epimerase [Roseibium sp. DSM 29163]